MSEKSEYIQQKLKVLPELPGVYQFLDKEGNIIYVGKAKKLNKRVASYFVKKHDSGKTRILVSKIADINHIVVETETDALLLENNLIKKYQPRYNVLLKDDGSLALTDYGVEKNLLIDIGCLDEDEIYCTPYYVSPERVTGNCCTQASDIYSLGIIFYEMLTGEKPFDSTSLVDLMKMHILSPVPTLPSNLASYQVFLEKLLAKCPDHRFADINAVLTSLQRI